MTKRELHDVFRMRMRIDHVMPFDHLWTFRVYQDGEMHIEIERCEDSDGGSTIPLREHELEFDFAATFWEPRGRTLGGDGQTSECSCRFFLTKYATAGALLAEGNWTVVIEGTLSSDHGFRGEWTHSLMVEYSLWEDALGTEEPHVIDCATESTATVEPVPTPLLPLTCGVYSFQGSIGQDEAATYGIRLEVELLPNGTIVGTLDASVGDADDDGEEKSVCGVWSRDHLYSFETGPHLDGYVRVHECDAWRHLLFGPIGSGSVASLPERICRRYRFDDTSDKAHLAITDMRRRWNTMDHALYPDSFRRAVRLCLLSSVSEEAPTYHVPTEL